MGRLPDLLPLARAALTCCAALAFAAPPRAQAPAPQGFRETIPGTTASFEMVPVAGGSVTVDGRGVSVEPFFIQRTEATWDMYDLFQLNTDAPAGGGVDATARPSQPYGAPDYNWGHAGYPVISVTLEASEAFARWLSARTGKTYRLPTEAEWIRAATLAAGKDLPPAALDALGWHQGNANGTTHPVAKRKPDELGLFDLFGNATEWVAAQEGNDRVTRGGSFRQPLGEIGPAARLPYDASWQDRDPQLPKSKWWLSDGPFVGFRLVTTAK
jgi:formylglycine-generating enzyme required for sulfatase activity